MFAFSHDKATRSLKEYFHALAMDKMDIYGILHIRRHFYDVIILSWRENKMVDILILTKRKYGVF